MTPPFLVASEHIHSLPKGPVNDALEELLRLAIRVRSAQSDIEWLLGQPEFRDGEGTAFERILLSMRRLFGDATSPIPDLSSTPSSGAAT